jgi:hypothetical protein
MITLLNQYKTYSDIDIDFRKAVADENEAMFESVTVILFIKRVVISR